jgi:hypothetical protein
LYLARVSADRVAKATAEFVQPTTTAGVSAATPVPHF